METEWSTLFITTHQDLGPVMIHTSTFPHYILAKENNKVVGRLEFEIEGHTMSIMHTYAYESGKGIGSLLLATAVELAEKNQYIIRPVCSFARKYFDKVTPAAIVDHSSSNAPV